MMMQGYSLLGYVNAVRQRSTKTLMVEGPSDQKLLARLQHTFADQNNCHPDGLVDGAAMLQDPADPALHGKGNRTKILELLRLAATDSRVDAALKNKFGTLIDREWDGIISGSEITGAWHPPSQQPPHFTTVGHSMENYFFTSKGFRAYLVQNFSEYVSRQFLDELEVRFEQMVALALAWSIGMRDLSAIKRASGLIWRNRIRWINGKYELLPSVEAELSSRQVQAPANYSSKVNADVAAYLAATAVDQPGVWLCHGHLGEEVLWSCVANLAVEFQVDSSVLDNIERGNAEGRFRYLVDFLSREQIADSVPLRDAVEWLCK